MIEKSTTEEKAKKSDAKDQKNAQIKSLNNQVIVADPEDTKNVPSANEKLDASLARE